MNKETIWFAAKQTVKNKASEEPTVQDEHIVNLRAAIRQKHRTCALRFNNQVVKLI